MDSSRISCRRGISLLQTCFKDSTRPIQSGQSPRSKSLKLHCRPPQPPASNLVSHRTRTATALPCQTPETLIFSLSWCIKVCSPASYLSPAFHWLLQSIVRGMKDRAEYPTSSPILLSDPHRKHWQQPLARAGDRKINVSN